MEEARDARWAASCSCAAGAALAAGVVGGLVAAQLPAGASLLPPGLSGLLTAGLVGGAVTFAWLRPWSDAPDEPRDDVEEARRGPPFDP